MCLKIAFNNNQNQMSLAKAKYCVIFVFETGIYEK
jgi:hypothetical protein